MKNSLSLLLAVAVVSSQSVKADVILIEGKKPSAYSIVVTPVGTDEVSYDLHVNTKFHRSLGNQKSYKISALNDYSEKQKDKISVDKTRRTVITVGSTVVGVVLGGVLADRWMKNAGPARIFLPMLGGVLAMIGGVTGNQASKEIHDLIWIKASERAHRSFITSKLVTNDEHHVYDAKDDLKAIAEFEKALDEVGATY